MVDYDRWFFFPFRERKSFRELHGEPDKVEKLRRLVEQADEVTRARFREFRKTQGAHAAAVRALQWRDEDRQAARLPGPLVLVEGKVRYRPFPGERTFPGDLIREPWFEEPDFRVRGTLMARAQRAAFEAA